MSLNIRARDLDAARHERFDRIGHVVRLIDHVGGIEPFDARELCIDQLVEDQKKLKGLDRSRIEVIVSVLAVVEMEAAELAELDDLATMSSTFTFGAWWPRSRRASARAARARARSSWCPSRSQRRIERRLIQKVLDAAAGVGQRR